MKALFTIVVLMAVNSLVAQEPVQEQQLENQAGITEIENEDDTFWQQLESLRRHPLDLNTVTVSELESLPMLNAMQIANFFVTGIFLAGW
ncbi:hypothetical protein [Paraflavitalea speifideaquila]|uniref:hypothetical protein n=1 Tax=Paraflavitalea speifideaquila TaxID=3076558 RepID=UPI0028E5A1D6|nr:hypothetical protein [Paraflavitalea speifideiaquila]